MTDSVAATLLRDNDDEGDSNVEEDDERSHRATSSSSSASARPAGRSWPLPQGDGNDNANGNANGNASGAGPAAASSRSSSSSSSSAAAAADRRVTVAVPTLPSVRELQSDSALDLSHLRPSPGTPSRIAELSEKLLARGFLPQLMISSTAREHHRQPHLDTGDEHLDPLLSRSKTPWVESLVNVNVRAAFQMFVNHLYAFYQDFGFKPKYAEVFSVMSCPSNAFLDMIDSRTPPEDVMVSTCSGSLQAQLQLLILQKSGGREQKAFLTHTNGVLVHLTVLVHTLQAGMRQFRERKATESASGSTGGTGTRTGISTGGDDVRRTTNSGLTSVEDSASLRKKLNALSLPYRSQVNGLGGRSDDGMITVLRRAFHRFTWFMMTAVVLFTLAVGATVQSLIDTYTSWVYGPFNERWALPLALAAVAAAIFAWGYTRAQLTATSCSFDACSRRLCFCWGDRESYVKLTEAQDMGKSYGSIE